MFLRSARRAVQDLCERRGGELESLTCEVSEVCCEVLPGATGGDVPDATSAVVRGATGGVVVAATAVVLFRGRRCVFRRGIWPPGHPATTRAAIYASVLEERLMTGVLPRPGGEATPIDL